MPTNKQGYMEKYYIENKDRWLARKLKSLGSCGKMVSKQKMSIHIKSKKHITSLATQTH